jgi:DegV family protein with EDD domain
VQVKIIVDSTADIPAEMMKEFTVVPLTVRFGDEEYLDGVDITRRQFYEMLVESDVMPQTSQVPPANFETCFEKTVDAGDTAVVITVSSKLSGTFQSAVIASEEFEDSIFIVDSRSVAIGTGILAQYALRLRNEGKTAAEIAAELESVRDNICVIALLDTLEYLKKGGRISATVAFAGGLLSIKPVAAVEDGEIKLLGKARGSKQGNNLLIKMIDEKGGIDFSMPILLGYTGLSDVMLKKYVEDSRYLWEAGGTEPEYTMIGSVIGAHAGPGAIAAAFFKNT